MNKIVQEIKLTLVELLSDYDIPDNELSDIAEEIGERIRTMKDSKNKFGSTYMTGEASRAWDSMKKGEKKFGPSAKPESI